MKKLPISGLALVSCLLALLATPVQATSLRCGVHLIQGGGRHGPSEFEVLRKCGEPQERRGRTWIYRLHGSKWEMRFNGNGILNTIRQL
jgi:hypothetical protein